MPLRNTISRHQRVSVSFFFFAPTNYYHQSSHLPIPTWYLKTTQDIHPITGSDTRSIHLDLWTVFPHIGTTSSQRDCSKLRIRPANPPTATYRKNLMRSRLIQQQRNPCSVNHAYNQSKWETIVSVIADRTLAVQRPLRLGPYLRES